MTTNSELIFDGESSIKQAFQLTKDWFEARKANLQMAVDSAAETITIGEGSNAIELKGRDVAVFKSGITVALQLFGDFPLTISVRDPDDDIQD